MLLTHRPVNGQDVSTICCFPQTAQELFFCFPKASFPLTPAQLLAAMAQRSDATVVEYAGRVVAFANFYRWERKGRCAIGNVMVCPSVRGRGVGRYLMAQMCSLAFAKHQATEVTVSCFHQNMAGLLMYPQLGFVPYAIEERQDLQHNRVALVHFRLLRHMASIPTSGALHIRHYTAADLAAVVAVFQQSVWEVACRDYSPAQLAVWAPEPPQSAAWAARLSGSGGVFVAERLDVILGFTRITDAGHIDLLFVHPECQGQGVARLLCEHAIAWALGRGASTLTADVSTTARPFFERMGFGVVRSQTVERQGVQLQNFCMVRPSASAEHASAHGANTP